MYPGTDDELSELVEDVAEHEAPVNGDCSPKCALVPVGDPCAELVVNVDNCNDETINLVRYNLDRRKVQESKQTNVKVEPTMVEG